MLMMIRLFFDNEVLAVPDYSFNFQAFFLAFGSFVLLYEVVMFAYSKKIKKIPLKEVMQEG